MIEAIQGKGQHRARAIYDDKIAALVRRLDGVCDAVEPRAGKVRA